MISVESVVVRGAEVAARELADEAVILSLRDGVYYTVKGVGLDVWRLIEREVSVGAIVSDLASRYDAPPAAIERDVIEFLEHVVERGLATVRA